MGEDPTRQGLVDTPHRFAKAFRFLSSGYREQEQETIGQGVFEEESVEGMILVKDIEMYSLCEHHLLPFFGVVHIAYLPHGKILGLSKFARIVERYSRRLQVQERLTQQIAEAIQQAIGAKGVGVMIEASHLCMMMRGVQKQKSTTMTTCFLGLFQDIILAVRNLQVN
jgi:GTP cyclohydrolase I